MLCCRLVHPASLDAVLAKLPLPDDLQHGQMSAEEKLALSKLYDVKGCFSRCNVLHAAANFPFAW